MSPDKLRELSAMLSEEKSVADRLGEAYARTRIEQIGEAAAALNYAASEIERLEKARALWESRWHAMAVSARALGRKVETLRDGMCRALSHIGSQEPQRAAVALGEALKETS